MRLLLDSHALYWWVTGNPRLSEKARSAVLDEDNEVLVSAVSFYELGSKQARGKLPGNPRDLRQAASADGFRELSIETSAMLRATQFQSRHRDPWDRILAAEAQEEQAAIVSVDPVFKEFGIERVW